MPDEPIPDQSLKPILLTDVKQFKEPVQQENRELKRRIETIKSETSIAIAASQFEPILINESSGWWLYQNSVYKVTDEGSVDEKVLLILDFVDRDRRKFERLKKQIFWRKI
jgi:hypothetical protein